MLPRSSVERPTFLEDDGDGALFAVVARDRQRHALRFVIDAENDELTGFRLSGNERSFNLHVRYRGIEFLFAHNFVHLFSSLQRIILFLQRKVPYSVYYNTQPAILQTLFDVFLRICDNNVLLLYHLP